MKQSGLLIAAISAESLIDYSYAVVNIITKSTTTQPVTPLTTNTTITTPNTTKPVNSTTYV